jgi:hypothetical protein
VPYGYRKSFDFVDCLDNALTPRPRHNPVADLEFDGMIIMVWLDGPAVASLCLKHRAIVPDVYVKALVIVDRSHLAQYPNLIANFELTHLAPRFLFLKTLCSPPKNFGRKLPLSASR